MCLLHPLKSLTHLSPWISECNTIDPLKPEKWRLKWVMWQDGNIKMSPGLSLITKPNS